MKNSIMGLTKELRMQPLAKVLALFLSRNNYIFSNHNAS
ncbi:protein of unknown function [Nitrosotalea devaniterrae]|uniref:Uncharacterized protein n=1 Tax=Nitrosotalea devaniterrae TaxID=1078905 RepID=A0A128A0P8_9ARCH|nr:protein of unknown function [Candidatus Nitrosotalea devanaterra]